MKLISQNHKDIEILINNAGLTKDNLFLRMKSDQWEEILDINLNSNFYIIKEILPLMIKNKRGNIIGIQQRLRYGTKIIWISLKNLERPEKGNQVFGRNTT